MLACLALLPLTKEPLVLVAFAFACWELMRCRRPKVAIGMMATTIPAALWWIYARIHFGAWFTSGDSALAAPFSGWRRALLDAGVNTYGPDAVRSEGAEATLVLLVVLLGVLAVAGIAALRLRKPVDLVYLLLGVLALCLAPNATVYLRDAIRNTAILLVLVPWVIASPPPRPTSWAHRGEGSSKGRARSPR
jgi:hypothetical protein